MDMTTGDHRRPHAAGSIRDRMRMLLVVVALLATAFHSGSAHAALGDTVDSIAADREALQALRHSTSIGPAFTVHEIDSGPTMVREYVSPSGIVFGLAWNGLLHPDLEQLLGSYSGEYRESLAQTPRRQGNRSLQVMTGNIVVEKWGHMRNLRGRAYAPALMPFGITADEIK
jgi:hypothetical protein